ncbi:MAG TPA: YafY family protein [Trebonia sp.]|jgi:predicted DNA-binding transcriptional regulator YafY|nr:YafY family protein [Trebonia sp.]
MANTSSRTLRLLSLLQNHRYWPGAELAERLDVSPRTLRRDVDRLRELGYPVQAHRGVDGGYQLAAGAALPPLVMDDEEAVAVAVALQSAAAYSAVAGVSESSVRALAKIAAVMPARLRRRVEALTAMTVPATWGRGGGDPAAAVDPATLTAIALACRDAERIRFPYTSASASDTRAASAQRHVEPHRLVPLRGRWYLVGYDLDRGDWRTFRLDRMTAPPQATGARFRPRELPAADAAAFVRAGIDRVSAAHEVEVLIDAGTSVVKEKIGRWASVESAGDNRCRFRMTTDSLDWPVFALGVVGADFEVVSPPELRALVADWGRRFSRETQRSGTPGPPSPPA